MLRNQYVAHNPTTAQTSPTENLLYEMLAQECDPHNSNTTPDNILRELFDCLYGTTTPSNSNTPTRVTVLSAEEIERKQARLAEIDNLINTASQRLAKLESITESNQARISRLECGLEKLSKIHELTMKLKKVDRQLKEKKARLTILMNASSNQPLEAIQQPAQTPPARTENSPRSARRPRLFNFIDAGVKAKYYTPPLARTEFAEKNNASRLFSFPTPANNSNSPSYPTESSARKRKHGNT